MTSKLTKHAVGIFTSREVVEQAMKELKESGFPMNRVSVLVKDSNHLQPLNKDLQKSISRSEVVKSSAAEGAATGGLLALAGGVAALLIPGIGLALAAESLLTVLLGSSAIAVSGGLVGALRGWFMPNPLADHYSNRVEQGDYLVALEGTEAEIHQAELTLNKWNIQEWHVFASSAS